MTRKLYERPCKSCGIIKLVPKAKLEQQCRSCYKITKIIHGMCYSSIYRLWFAMKDRCLNENNKGYKNYGARGIMVCERWLVFENFYQDMGDKPPRHSLDRINNSGNYCPENCQWATKREQESNTRRNVNITAFGRIKNITQWAEEFGLSHKVVSKRLELGWTPEKAVSTPLMTQFSRSKQTA